MSFRDDPPRPEETEATGPTEPDAVSGDGSANHVPDAPERLDAAPAPEPSAAEPSPAEPSGFEVGSDDASEPVAPPTPEPAPTPAWEPIPTWSPPAPQPLPPPPAPAGWTPLPPVRSADEAPDYGWPRPALPPAMPPPAEPPPPHFQSRNPVDRLTRGLPNPVRVTIDWIVTIVGAVAIVLLVKAFVVNPYRIPSSSMETTLHCAQPAQGCQARFSDRVLANRFLYRIRDPRRGEIIVFQTPPAARVKCGAGGTFVKRLVGLPGETVEVRLIRGDGYVFINGKKLDEPYVDETRRGASSEFGPVKVRPDSYFMMGDNRGQSCDSRMWGTVPRSNLIGKVFATYWPPNRVSLH